jgi:hypothetical protein
MEFLIKASNVLFSFADGVVLFLLLRRLGLRDSVSVAGASLFLLNPAVIFAQSIWGQIETIAIFFILVSIYFAESGWLLAAWLALVAALLSKPQVMVLAPLLGLVYLRRFPLVANLRAMAWTTVVFFMLLTPFAIAISPSLPIDIGLRVVGVFGGAIDPSQNSVAGDSYSLWPLVTRFAAGQSQMGRFFYPSNVTFLGNLSYNSASNFLWGGLILAVALVLVLSRRASGSLDRYAPLIATAMFGFLMFKTGMLSRYFVYALPLLVLTRRSLPTWAHYTALAVASVTTFVGIVGGFTLESAPTPWAAPAFHQGYGLPQYAFALFSSDWFITCAVGGNLWVLATLATASIKSFASRVEPSSHSATGLEQSPAGAS